MTVWSDIDALRARHEVELEQAREALNVRRGGALKVQHGLWWCSWRPTRGDRTTRRVSAPTARELIARLDALIFRLAAEAARQGSGLNG